MTEEHKNYDDHAAESYDMASIPYGADPPVDGHAVESSVEADKIASEEPPPLTQWLPSSGDSDIVQAPPSSPFSQAGVVPPVVPRLPEKKRGLHLSLKNTIFLVLILLVVLGSATGLFIYFTRSTPGRTLDAFCSALTKNDAGTAYQQFSPTLQRVLPEKDFANVLTHDSITQCSYMPVDEAKASVQTGLKLQHGSRGINNDRVTLGKDAQGTWRIVDINVAMPEIISHRAVVHHLTLSARQTFSKAAMVFAVNGGNMGAGLAVAAGTRIVLFASGKMNIAASNEQVEANGLSSCPATTLPEAKLNCYSIIYSSGSINQVGMAGEQADFIPHTDGVFFFGLNAPDQSQARGSFQLTVLIIPDKTATGIWEQPNTNGFVFSQVGNSTISAHIYAQNYAHQISSVSFYLVGDTGARTRICEEPYDGVSEVVKCQWNLRMGGSSDSSGPPIKNGPVKIGFSLTTSDGRVDDPDGAISGVARYIATGRSYNYAGYAAQSIEQPQSTHYQSATARWTVPAVHCTSGETSDSSVWAGMTGISSKSQIAQLGTSSGCQSGEPLYYAWWEMYPAPSQNLDNSIQPGDVMVATVNYQLGKFHLTLENVSQHWRFATTQGGSDSDALLAECIVEPAAIVMGDNQVISRLSNFGSVSVNCLANNQPIGMTGPQNIVYQMVGPQQHATTSDLDQRGANFTVKWGSR